jgi:hypothetical protein
MDIMNSALTSKTNHNDFERSSGSVTIRKSAARVLLEAVWTILMAPPFVVLFILAFAVFVLIEIEGENDGCAR